MFITTFIFTINKFPTALNMKTFRLRTLYFILSKIRLKLLSELC